VKLLYDARSYKIAFSVIVLKFWLFFSTLLVEPGI